MTDPRPVHSLDYRALLRVLSEHHADTKLTADTLRELLSDTVQVKADRMGALFLHAAEAGYIERVGFTRSTGEKARGHVLVVWRRTRKAIPAHVCEVSAA